MAAEVNESLEGHHNITMSEQFYTANYSDAKPFDRWATETHVLAYIVPVLFAIIFIVGIIGNGMLIVSVLANKVMRNVPNILIVCLSLGDFLLVLVSVPMTSTIYTFSSWPYGSFGCKLNEFLQTLSLGVTVISLTALSADRYLAIVDPMAKFTGRSRNTTVAIAVGIWFVSFLFAIPDIVISDLVERVNFENQTVAICFPDPMDQYYGKVYATLRFLIFFLIPVVIIAFFYLMMARILVQSSTSIPTETKTEAANYQRQIAARKKVARVVFSFVIIFIVCWLPTHIYRMWFFYDPSDMNTFWMIFKTVGFCLQFINSCINPFALYFLSAQFRKYYNRYLFCCCQKREKYRSLEPTSTMHNLNSRQRRGSGTNTSMVHSQSMC